MNYLSMTKAEVANGQNVRLALWVSGCNHHCKNCHNPESWDCNAGKPFTEDDLNRLIAELSLPYYDGLTLTGGDPLHQNNIEDITKLVIKVKERLPMKTIWLYTGCVFDNVKHLEMMNYIDVLVDGEYVEALRDTTLAFKGSSNQRVIDVQKSLKEDRIVLCE